MATATLLVPTTPLDYHRIVSPSLHIPEDPSIPIPVGILACQRDPLLRSLLTTVVSATLSQPAAPPAAKKVKKAVIAPTLPPEPILEVILHDTVIFPEGGGQPTDTGIITTSADGITWEVLQSKRHGGHAVHYVRIPTGSDSSSALLAFAPGITVTVALDQAGYDRRYDHMSMHTSQHLLSALLETRLALPTLSWSLTAAPSPCYVEIPRGITTAEVASIQDEANRLVFEGRKVHVEVAELDADREKENTVPVLESGRAVGKALPQDYTGGVKRVVVIDGVDKNPCCGTHLPSIHNLQLFLLPHTDALARSSSTTARLYFLAGPRLITYLSTTHVNLTAAATTLSCGAPLVPERVAQVVDERRRAEKRVSDLEAELATHIAQGLLTAMLDLDEGRSSRLFTQHVHRIDDTGNALGFLSSVAFNLTDKGRDAEFVVVLSSSPSSQNASSVSTVLVVGSNDKIVKDTGEGLKTKLNVKGGGKGPRWSGKFTGVWRDNKEGVIVGEVLKGL